MKKAFIAAACLVGIIAVRMLLSVALSEHIAEVFTRVSVTFLFFYFCLISTKSRRQAKNHCTTSGEM